MVASNLYKDGLRSLLYQGQKFPGLTGPSNNVGKQPKSNGEFYAHVEMLVVADTQVMASDDKMQKLKGKKDNLLCGKNPTSSQRFVQPSTHNPSTLQLSTQPPSTRYPSTSFADLDSEIVKVAWIFRDDKGNTILHSRHAFSNVGTRREDELIAIQWAVRDIINTRQQRIILDSSCALAKDTFLNKTEFGEYLPLTNDINLLLRNL
ncbi:hypothetical protein YC2023_098332 [Brassica napus]